MLPLFIGTLGLQELLIIGGLCVLLFGAKRVPELLGGIGKGIRELKKGILGDDE